VQRTRYQMIWTTGAGALIGVEPHAAEIERHAPTLMAAYNDEHNAPLLGHTELLSEDDVIDSYLEMFEDGGYSFMFLRDGALIADGDLRRVTATEAEMAFLVTAVASQGQGLGTRVAIMLHAFGFAHLQLQRIYASILPSNTASRRVFDKLGHVVDDSETGRGYAEDPGDVVTVVDRETFARLYATQLAQIEIRVREA
jgi:RimJ/RimL family protein N-acetyltransferase